MLIFAAPYCLKMPSYTSFRFDRLPPGCLFPALYAFDFHYAAEARLPLSFSAMRYYACPPLCYAAFSRRHAY